VFRPPVRPALTGVIFPVIFLFFFLPLSGMGLFYPNPYFL